jgi:parvulin-like peptidyl-prolyl isomerase
LEKKDMKFVVSLLSFLSALVAFGLVGCGRGGDVLVEFNELKITKEAYMKRMETLDAVAVRVPQGQFPAGNLRLPVASPISHQTLQRMLAELALLQAAKDEGVAPSKEDIERRKELYTKIDPNYITQRKEIGMSISDIDYYIELELARENLLKRGTPEKTLEDVEKYIKEHPDEFRRPPMVTLRYIIVTSPEEQKKVDESLMRGYTFEQAAAEFSVAPNASREKGSFPPGSGATLSRPVPINQLDPPLRKAVENTGERKISDWFQYGQHLCKIYVESKVPSQFVEPSSAQKELMRIQWTVREGSANNDLDRLLLKKLMDAKVKIHAPYLRKVWDALLDEVKTQAKELLPGVAPETKTSSSTP